MVLYMLKPIISTLLCLAVLAPSALAEEFRGQVVSVFDGDSLLVSRDKTSTKVILYGVDCPEIKQEFGTQARKYTVDQCLGKTLVFKVHGMDTRGRTIAEVFLADGSSLNEDLVRKGLAWWSDKYAPGERTLQSLHQSAKASKTGLWAAQNAVAPWLFRNGQKSVTATIKKSTTP